MQSISIHALREESDTVRMGKKQRRKNFNPRPPRGERRTAFSTNSSSRLFQSTPSARRATAALDAVHLPVTISIHALREESDVRHDHTYQQGLISIHALREESDAHLRWCKCRSDDFNPRPPRGERRRILQHGASLENISIHALREESDGEYYNTEHHWKIFQSTPSARRATCF